MFKFTAQTKKNVLSKCVIFVIFNNVKTQSSVQLLAIHHASSTAVLAGQINSKTKLNIR